MSVPKKIPKAPSEAEERFLLHWRADGYDERPLREYKFHPRRDWRFDFAWPEKKLAVEIQGLERVSEQLVRSQLEVQAGQTFTPLAVSRDIRRLYYQEDRLAP